MSKHAKSGVYVARLEGTDQYKIGKSMDTRRRLGELVTQNYGAEMQMYDVVGIAGNKACLEGEAIAHEVAEEMGIDIGYEWVECDEGTIKRLINAIRRKLNAAGIC